eukprot:1016441_1
MMAGINFSSGAQISIRQPISTIARMCHFASNLCQKLNKFQQSLKFVNQAIRSTKDRLRKQYLNRIDQMEDPMSSGDDVSSDDNNDTQPSTDEQEMMMKDSMDNYEYKMDIELSADVIQMCAIKDKQWSEMDTEERLFYYIQKQISDMLLTRGLAHSNLGNHKEAFYDAYVCTLIHPKNRTAWNNRAFAWYQLGKHEHCIKDCTFALNVFGPSKTSQFTRGLLCGNRGLAEYKLKLYHKAVIDLNLVWNMHQIVDWRERHCKGYGKSLQMQYIMDVRGLISVLM